MASCDRGHDLSKDNDLDIDFAHDPMQIHAVRKPTADVKAAIIHSKSSGFGEYRVDSGLPSSLEATNAINFDKSPVQCLDTDEVEKKLTSLSLTDDEGISLPSLRSCDSENSKASLQEPQEIEVDLYQKDEDGDTIVHVAILSLMKESALALIDLSVDTECLNLQNYLLQSPLHLAVLTEQADVVKALIAKGVDVTLRDQQGNTALHIACRKGDRDSVSMLVQSFGNDVSGRVKYFSMRNCEGLTCAHVAAQYKEFIILGHLFAKGADVNMGDAKSGRTMLHYAVENKDIETVSLLLTHPKIDVDCKTFKGETPLVLAYWRNYQDIVKKLKAKGACFSYELVESDLDDESYS